MCRIKYFTGLNHLSVRCTVYVKRHKKCSVNWDIPKWLISDFKNSCCCCWLGLFNNKLVAGYCLFTFCQSDILGWVHIKEKLICIKYTAKGLLSQFKYKLHVVKEVSQ